MWWWRWSSNTLLTKEGCPPGRVEQRSARCQRATHNDVQFITYEFFISGIFHLVFQTGADNKKPKQRNGAVLRISKGCWFIWNVKKYLSSLVYGFSVGYTQCMCIHTVYVHMCVHADYVHVPMCTPVYRLTENREYARCPTGSSSLACPGDGSSHWTLS